MSLNGHATDRLPAGTSPALPIPAGRSTRAVLFTKQPAQLSGPQGNMKNPRNHQAMQAVSCVQEWTNVSPLLLFL